MESALEAAVASRAGQGRNNQDDEQLAKLLSV
jgi:hypothetical protein